MHAFPRVRRV